MPIIVPCACGKVLPVPESAAGTRVRCGNCQSVLTVPAASPPAAPPAPPEARPAAPVAARPVVRPAPPPEPVPPLRPRPVDEPDEPDARPARFRPRRLLDDEDEEDAPPNRPKRGKKAPGRQSADPAKQRLVLILAVAGVVLLGCLGAGGLGVYYAFFSGPSESSPEGQLVGDWETDPDAYKDAGANNPFGVAMVPLVKMTFNKDHTYRMEFMWEMEGKWTVVSRSDNLLQVKLTFKMWGMDADNPPTVNIRVRDRDHLDFDSDQPSLTMHVKLRRVGTGSPVKSIAQAQAEAAGQAQFAPDPPASRPPQPAPGPGGNLWLSYTLDQLVTLDLPEKPAKSRSGVTARGGELLRFTEYTVPWAGPAVTVRVYRQPRVKAKPMDTRSLAAYVGGLALSESGGAPQLADRAFTQAGKPAAVFVRPGGKEPGVHLAIGDENGVCLVSVAAQGEQDPTVKRLFPSVQLTR